MYHEGCLKIKTSPRNLLLPSIYHSDFSEAFMHVKISYRFPKEITTVMKVAQSLGAEWIRICKISNHTKCWPGCRPTETPPLCWWEHKMVQPLWKTLYQFLWKLDKYQPCDPVIPLPKYLPKKKESVSLYKDLSTNVHSCFICNWEKKKKPKYLNMSR